MYKSQKINNIVIQNAPIDIRYVICVIAIIIIVACTSVHNYNKEKEKCEDINGTYIWQNPDRCYVKGK